MWGKWSLCLSLHTEGNHWHTSIRKKKKKTEKEMKTYIVNAVYWLFRGPKRFAVSHIHMLMVTPVTPTFDHQGQCSVSCSRTLQHMWRKGRAFRYVETAGQREKAETKKEQRFEAAAESLVDHGGLVSELEKTVTRIWGKKYVKKDLWIQCLFARKIAGRKWEGVDFEM